MLFFSVGTTSKHWILKAGGGINAIKKSVNYAISWMTDQRLLWKIKGNSF
jgi:hypothetical protein